MKTQTRSKMGEKSTAPVTYWWNGDLVSDSCLATFPHSPSILLLLREFVNLPGESHDQAVGIQRVWKLWEMQFRCSKTCRLLVDAVHILATGHRGQEFPVSRPLTWPHWVQYYITYIVISPISPSKHGMTMAHHPLLNMMIETKSCLVLEGKYFSY